MPIETNRHMIAGAFAFAVPFVLGVALQEATFPNVENKSAQVATSTVLRVYQSSGDRAKILIGGVLMILAALALLWFVVALSTRLTNSDAATPTTPYLLLGFGAFAAVCVAISGSLGASVAGSISLAHEPLPSADVARLLPELGDPVLFFGFGWAMTAVIGMVTFTGRRLGLLPRWLGVLGRLVVAVGIVGVAFFPLAGLLMAVWVVVVGILAPTQPRAPQAR